MILILILLKNLIVKGKKFCGKIKASWFSEKKADFDNKLISFNKRVTSNKTKHLKVQKKLDSLITKDYIFFLSGMYFTSNEGYQSTFVHQSTLDTFKSQNSKFKKDKGTGNRRSIWL